MKFFIPSAIFIIGIFILGCGNTQESPITQDAQNNESELIYNKRNITPLDIDFHSTTPINNKAAYVTSQCYTKTIDDKGAIHNPCFSCHINSKLPNYVDDWNLQQENKFGEYSKINRFTNLFKDRSSLIAQISNEEMLSYVRENNYIHNGQILLSDKLQNPPQEWDINNDGKWSGYIPDCYFDFDSEGFDKAQDGNFTGWRAFGYYPFLGTFWPTNGSTDDVLIRLPKEFMLDENSNFNLEVYKLNLSIVESLIKQKNMALT